MMKRDDTSGILVYGKDKVGYYVNGRLQATFPVNDDSMKEMFIPDLEDFPVALSRLWRA